jgi:hypothetical protein
VPTKRKIASRKSATNDCRPCHQWTVDDGRLQDARGRFQQAIETRDQTMADGVMHAGYALVLMQRQRP